MGKTEDNEVNLKSLISALESGKKGYMKKPNSWKKTFLWFEKINKANNNWFVNVGEQKRNKEEGLHTAPSYWITARELPTFVKWYQSTGYKLYINE